MELTCSGVVPAVNVERLVIISSTHKNDNRKAPAEKDLADLEELGQTLAAGVDFGIF